LSFFSFRKYTLKIHAQKDSRLIIAMHGKTIIKLVNLYISLGMGYKKSFNYIQYTQIPLAFLFNQIKNHPKVVYRILVA